MNAEEFNETVNVTIAFKLEKLSSRFSTISQELESLASEVYKMKETVMSEGVTSKKGA